MESNGLLMAMYVLAVVIEIGMPVTLAILIVRKGKIGWIVLLTGLLTFIGSQVVHIPLLQVPALLQKLGVNVPMPSAWPTWGYALYLGIMAGLCEETARLVGFKVLKKKASDFKGGLGLGIGHGGTESIIVGLSVLGSLIAALSYNATAQLQSGVSQDEVNMALAQLQSMLSIPWHLPLAGAVERITAVASQIFMSVLVWQTVFRGKAWGYWAAVLYHTALDALAVVLSSLGLSAWAIEASLLPFLAFSLVMIWFFWKKEKQNPAEPASLQTGTEELPTA